MGWESSQKLREEILTTMEDFVRNKKLRIHSERCITEMMSFVYNKDSGKIGAQEGQHDDLVIALALTVMGLTDYINNSPVPVSQIQEEEDPLGLSSSNQAASLRENYFKGRSFEDLRWLIDK